MALYKMDKSQQLAQKIFSELQGVQGWVHLPLGERWKYLSLYSGDTLSKFAFKNKLKSLFSICSLHLQSRFWLSILIDYFSSAKQTPLLLCITQPEQRNLGGGKVKPDSGLSHSFTSGACFNILWLLYMNI